MWDEIRAGLIAEIRRARAEAERDYCLSSLSRLRDVLERFKEFEAHLRTMDEAQRILNLHEHPFDAAPAIRQTSAAARRTVEDVFGPSAAAPDPRAERVAAVMDLWTRTFAACRNGATSRPNPQRDYAAFKALAEQYQDQAHLEAMLRLFFTADDIPEWAKLRTPACFARLAPELDAAVRGA
jgi:hypothetical protein